MSPPRVVARRADAAVSLSRMDRGGREVLTLILSAATASIILQNVRAQPPPSIISQQNTMGTKKYTGHPPATVPHDTGLHVPPHVLRFLNSLPVDGDLVDWLLKFREALRLLLGDVDRIAIESNIDRPGKRRPRVNWSMSINQYIYVEEDNVQKNLPAIMTISANKGGLDKEREISDSLEEMCRLKLPLHEYQSPHCYDYFMPESNVRLGSLMLFRRRGAASISFQTLKTMESLHSFFVFVFSDLKARYFYHNTGAAIFNWSILVMKDGLQLTDREFQILVFRFYGFTFKQIADQLCIAHATVRKHFQSMLRKGNARSVIELFTRRFMPDLEEDIVTSGEIVERLTSREVRESKEPASIYLW